MEITEELYEEKEDYQCTDYANLIFLIGEAHFKHGKLINPSAEYTDEKQELNS